MNYYKYMFYWIYKNQKKKWDSHFVGISGGAMLLSIIDGFILIDFQSLLLRINLIEDRFKPNPWALIIICTLLIFNIVFFAINKKYLLIEAKYDDLPPKKHKRTKTILAIIITTVFLGLFIL